MTNAERQQLTALKPFVVGIDPGESTGFGVYRRAVAGKPEKVLAWMTTTSVGAFRMLNAQFLREDTKVFIELPGTFMYRRNDDPNDKQHVRDRKNQMMAANRQKAKDLFELLNDDGWDVELVAPVKETKWDQQRFRLFAKTQRSANEHERDAVRLAFYYANKRK